LALHGVVVASVSERLDLAALRGQTPVLMAVENQLAGCFLMSDPLKPDVSEAIQRLRTMQIKPLMLSGDRAETAQSIGRQAGLRPAEIKADVSPLEKLEFLKAIQQIQDGRGRAIVGMVGDGINDAPALAQADVSIAIGTGTDIAMQTAQITLVHGDIIKVVEAIALSRAIFTTIRQNLFWAFFYNVIALPLAALGLLNPMIAAAAMALSSVTVVLNSLRLRRA
jgi:Cu+-exporting ATPase